MKKLVLVIVVVLTTLQLQAQNYKYGKVSIEEVKDNIYEKDTTANGVRLYKNRKTYVDYLQGTGWVFITEVHERIKIINKDGFDYATKKVRLYKANRVKQKISSIKGITYNEVGGKLEKTKLKKSSMFEEDLSKYWTLKTFTMPNVSEGSIIEWQYKIISPYWTIDDLEIQSDMPTVHYTAKVKLPKYFKFKRVVRGSILMSPKETVEMRKMRVKYAGSSVPKGGIIDEGSMGELEVMEYITEYNLNDIPALKPEPYVNNMNNYRGLVAYELSSVQFPGSTNRNYGNTWEDVVRQISKSDDFGKQLNRTKFLRDKAAELKGSSENEKELIARAYHFIKNEMNWDGYYGKYTQKGIQKAFKEKSGNVAEINLMLVGLLRECGITANPVLVSTRKHGVPLFPTLEGFNYVVVGAAMEGGLLLLDATDKELPAGMLPPRALNWEGTLVLDDGQSKKVSLYSKTHSQYNSMMRIQINDDGSVEGQRSANVSNLDAYSFRKAYGNHDQEELEAFILNDNEYDDLSDLEMKNMDDLYKPISQAYKFELDDGVEIVGDEMYFSPLFNLALETNPFVLEERSYPVDFIYPRTRKRIVNITIPEGYEISSLPAPVKMNLPDGLGSFLFNISKTPNGINVMSTFKINSTIIPVSRYQDLKEFYNQRVKKETEKVVLKKI